jgi:hypothetical protein
VKQPTTDNSFEERLLARLRAEVAERGAADAARGEGAARRRRAPRLALGALAAAVAAAAAAILAFGAGGGNTPRAFAVEPQEGGGVTFSVYSVRDAAALERALGEAGINSQVTWLPAGTVCREPHFTPSSAAVATSGSLRALNIGGPQPVVFSVGSERQWRERNQGPEGESTAWNLDPETFGPDQTLVLSGAPAPYGGDPEGGSVTYVRLAEGPVEPCEAVPAPAGSPLLEGS